MATKNFGTQTGRSMVEILGVLAVVSVLSIGGIMGYSYGMDKYRANETTQDVNLRMLDLMTQLTNHPDLDPNISNAWGVRGKIYEMDIAYDEVTSEYALEVNNVPKRVCKMIFDNLISSYSIEVGTMRYEDSSMSDICGENNTMAFYLAEPTNCGKYILCNECQTCDETTQTCTPVADNTPCAVDDKNGVCLSGECEIPCSINDDCPFGYFCQAGEHCGGSNKTCESLYSQCSNSVHPFSFEYDGEQFTWYALFPVNLSTQDSALNACKALGRNLITSADVEPREKGNAAYVSLMNIPLFQKWRDHGLRDVFFSYADDGPCHQIAAMIYSPDFHKNLTIDLNRYKITLSLNDIYCGNGRTSGGGQWIICK